MLFELMHPSWQALLGQHKDLLLSIERKVLSSPDFTPAPSKVMRALETPVDEVRVLFLGQDPYPTKEVACGLAFANSPGTKAPPSLRNLMRELEADLPKVTASGEVSKWANQGVLLLNSSLTTRIGVSGAHQKIWREFTTEALVLLARARSEKFVSVCLGREAKKLADSVKLTEIVYAPHPSPLSAHRGFFGSKIYSRVNKTLVDKGEEPIDWSC